MEKQVNFDKYIQQTKKQIKQYKKVINEMKNQINQDFGIVVDLETGYTFFLNNEKAAEKICKMQNYLSKLLKDLK